ncbi:MAG: hypothetical protein EA402_00390 [Planctomycetota bacterium]|nr:MAG: hypothetical protein EA402_00390 [Planctomycetota bacterium]
MRALRHLKERGLKAPYICTTDKCMGLVQAIAEVYPETRWQCCTVHFNRNVLSHVSDRASKGPRLCRPTHALCTGRYHRRRTLLLGDWPGWTMSVWEETFRIAASCGQCHIVSVIWN